MRKIIFALLLGAGCAGTVGYQATASYETAPMPDMAYVSPGVQVIADYDEPVFYTDGFYWRYDASGTWYRSNTWTGGWVYASAPRPLLTIQPRTYIRYRPSGYVSHRPARVLRDRYRHDDRRGDRRDRRHR